MNAQDSLLIAQLSRVTIEFLAVLNRERRQNTRAQELLDPLLTRAGYNQRNSLINQGILIGYAYLTMVWLWEQLPTQFTDAIPNFSLDDPVAPWPNLADTILRWEYNFSQPSPQSLHPWLRHIRNALSHGRVSFDPIDDDALIFADAMPNAPHPHTLIRLSPQRLGSVADLVMSTCEQSKA